MQMELGFLNVKHEKRCTQCRAVKPLSEFYTSPPASRCAGGLLAHCKDCERAQQRKWSKVRYRRERGLPVDCALAQGRKVTATSDGYKTIKCPTCGETKPRNAFNRDRSRNSGRSAICKVCKFCRSHSGKTKQRAAMEAARSDGTVTAQAVNRLVDRVTSCPYCGAALTDRNRCIDHMDPLARGGMHSISNLVPCCRDCNTMKASNLFDVWINELDECCLSETMAEYRRAAPAQLHRV